MRFLRRDKPPVNADALEALEEAQRSLAEIQKRGREVTSVANAMKKIRERNHFAEQLEAIILRTGGN